MALEPCDEQIEQFFECFTCVVAGYFLMQVPAHALDGIRLRRIPGQEVQLDPAGAVGNRVTAIWTTGTDLGTQNASFISLEAYRDLFKPFHKAVNDWMHEHTGWKSMIHSCGSVRSLIEDFIDAGFDILNPVQCSAANMNPSELKSAFGDRITFWGGGVDTQHTLPFGTPKEVRKEVRKRIKTFAPGGGFVFATVHNIQSRVPVENLLAMFETVRESRSYR